MWFSREINTYLVKQKNKINGKSEEESQQPHVVEISCKTVLQRKDITCRCSDPYGWTSVNTVCLHCASGKQQRRKHTRSLVFWELIIFQTADSWISVSSGFEELSFRVLLLVFFSLLCLSSSLQHWNEISNAIC